MAVRSLVVEVGGRLRRSPDDVEPFVQALKDNWYDSISSVAEATADDLTALGLPRRFAVDLVAAAADWRPSGGKGKSFSSFSSKGSKGGKSKGKEKGDHNDDYDRGKGKSKGKKGKDDFDDKGKGKGKSKAKDDFDDKGKGKGKSKGKAKGKSKGGELRHTIPIDLDGVNTDFVFRPKILGNKGANVFHIQDQTGVNVELKGSDEDGYMEFVLVAKDEDSMDRAASMCEDLIGTVFDEFEDWRKHSHGGGKSKGKGKKGDRGDSDKGKGKGKGKKGDFDSDKGKGKGKAKGKSKTRVRGEDELEARIPIDSSQVDADFGLRAKLVGEAGQNVKHIERSSGASVTVEYDDGDGMGFLIFAQEESALDSAKDMCQDLLNTVLEEAGVSTSKRPRAGSDRKSGKGKRKGDRGGEDTPASKRSKTEGRD